MATPNNLIFSNEGIAAANASEGAGAASAPTVPASLAEETKIDADVKQQFDSIVKSIEEARNYNKKI